MNKYKVGQGVKRRNPNDSSTYNHGSITAVQDDGGLYIKWSFPSMSRYENEFIPANLLHTHEIEVVYDPKH